MPAQRLVLQLDVVRHVHVFQHLLRDALEDRSRNLPALMQSIGESRITAIVTAGLFTGAKPMNEATYFVLE